MKLKKLVLSAVLSALSFVFYEFVDIPIPPSESPLLTLSLGIIPIFFIAYFCGTYYSIISSVIIDLMGYFLVGASKGYAFNIGYTLNALIGGLIFGLVLKNKKKLDGTYGTLIISIISILFSLVIITVFMSFYNKIDLSKKFKSEYIMFIISGIFLISNIIIIFISYSFKNKEENNAVLLSYLIYQFIVSLLLTPLWIYLMTKTHYIVLLSTRMITAPITLFIYYAFTKMILIPLKRIYNNE